MKKHFPRFEQPYPAYKTITGAAEISFVAVCGFSDRNISIELSEINCLLCLRSIARTVRDQTDKIKHPRPDPDLSFEK